MIKKLIFILIILLPVSAEAERDVFVRKLSWHTGIIVQVDSLSKAIIPELSDFSEYEHAEFGMGDEYYYQAEDPGYFEAAKAAIIPSSAVVKVQGKIQSIAQISDYSDFMYKVNLSDKEYKKLLLFISKSIKRNSENKALISSNRLNGNVIFCKSTEKYHIMNTCNTWVANALEESGFVKISGTVIRSEELEKILKKIGKKV